MQRTCVIFQKWPQPALCRDCFSSHFLSSPTWRTTPNSTAVVDTLKGSPVTMAYLQPSFPPSLLDTTSLQHSEKMNVKHSLVQYHLNTISESKPELCGENITTPFNLLSLSAKLAFPNSAFRWDSANHFSCIHIPTTLSFDKQDC